MANFPSFRFDPIIKLTDRASWCGYNIIFPSICRVSLRTVTHSELLLDINNFSKTIVHVIRQSEFSFKIVLVITIVVSNPVNFLVNARPMTSEHCQRILDDVTIFRHLAVESTFLYSLHPGSWLWSTATRSSPLGDFSNYCK